ncbi:hypothetical protein CJU90_3278 [Yarrowia sp. C11]|nr:hypothetical protein CKK34_4725 [Yarrowia sp. E02]KAG5369757.1 hypothetical protein CJU90_3278 [Yarrowia sp. C11]
MYSRYHPGYLSDFNTPTKIPATETPVEDEEDDTPTSHFYTMHEDGQEFFETCTCPVVLSLEKSRRDVDKGVVSPEDHLTTALTLFSDLDLPFHRRASALLRYLTLQMFENLPDATEASLIFNKFACYYQAHDWAALLKALKSEKEILLLDTKWEYLNNENRYYTDTHFVPTPDSIRKQEGAVVAETPVTRKRAREPTPEPTELLVCPSLVNL